MKLRPKLRQLKQGLQVQVWNDNAPAKDTLISELVYEDLPGIFLRCENPTSCSLHLFTGICRGDTALSQTNAGLEGSLLSKKMRVSGRLS